MTFHSLRLPHAFSSEHVLHHIVWQNVRMILWCVNTSDTSWHLVTPRDTAWHLKPSTRFTSLAVPGAVHDPREKAMSKKCRTRTAEFHTQPLKRRISGILSNLAKVWISPGVSPNLSETSCFGPTHLFLYRKRVFSLKPVSTHVFRTNAIKCPSFLYFTLLDHY